MKRRIQVSLNPELVQEAKRLMAARKFDSFSGLLETLIREEWERGGALGKSRVGPVVYPAPRGTGGVPLNDLPVRKLKSIKP
jgi:hypothetical protein